MKKKTKVMSAVIRLLKHMFAKRSDYIENISIVIKEGKKAKHDLHFICPWCECEWITMPRNSFLEQVDEDSNGNPILEARSKCPNCKLTVSINVYKEDIYGKE